MHSGIVRIVLVVTWLMSFCAVMPAADEDQTRSSDPEEVLQTIHDSYYDLGKAGLRRAACYIECKDVLDKFDAGARRVLRRVKYEAIIEPGKSVQVKPRDVPPHFGAEARAGIDMYALGMQKALNDIGNGIDTVARICDPKKLKWLGELKLVEENGQRLIVLDKRNRKKKDEPAIGVIKLDKNDLPEEFRIRKGETWEITKFKTKLRDDMWMITEVDIAKYDAHDRLIERSIIEIDYDREKGIYLPEEMTISQVDKKGKPLDLRNEANPITAKFTNYEVEKRE